MIIRDAVYEDIDNIAKLYISNWKETYKVDFIDNINILRTK